MTLVERLKHRPAPLALAAGLILTACAPAAHTDGVSGGGSETMLRIGDTARDAGDIGAALPIYRRAHALAPLELAPLLRLAETLGDVGAHREAGNAWQRALLIEPRSFEARLGYGETLAALDQPVLALEQFRLARELGASADLFNGMGVAHDLLGDAEAAQAAYREGLASERSLKLPNNPDADYTAYGRVSEGRLGTTSGGAATTEINNRMLTVCNAMKSEGIIIFAITFRLNNSTTQDLYRNCATSPAHYFDSPSNDELQDVFHEIGNELTNLRLAQ